VSDARRPPTRVNDARAPLTRVDDALGEAADRATIRVSAVLAVDDAGRLLVVRKRGTDVWMQPGGKPEPGETPAETLARELHEELGVRLDPAELEPLGTFTTAAANEPGTTLIADVFRARIEHPVVADAEIDAVMWMHPRDFAHHQLAPLIIEHMLALVPGGDSAVGVSGSLGGDSAVGVDGSQGGGVGGSDSTRPLLA